MREFRTYGSVRGALSDGCPYRDHCLVSKRTKLPNLECESSLVLCMT